MNIILSILFLLNLNTWSKKPLPQNAYVLKIARGICGDESTYYIKSPLKDSKKETALKWIIDFIETEPAIESYEFAYDTGTYIEADQLKSFLNSNQKMISKEMIKKLENHKVIKEKLKKDRLLNNANSYLIKDVRENVDKYHKSADRIRSLLLKDFKVESASTGSDCD